MASNFRLVLGAFGINKLRTVIYKSQLGEDAPARSSSFEEFEDVQPPTNLNTGVDDGNVSNWMGLPVFCDIQFPLSDGKTLILDTVLMTVNQQKNIVRTTIQGRPGTIKEYVSDGDYDVSIKGALVSPQTSDYPEQIVRELHEVLSRSESIDIVCDYLRLFDIHRLTITAFNFPQQVGYQNMQLFEITALSDTDENLIEDA